MNIVKRSAGSLKAAAVTLGAMLALGIQSASAALSTEIATGLTAVQTDGLALVDLVWPVVVALTAAFIMFRLFKRGVRSV